MERKKSPDRIYCTPITTKYPNTLPKTIVTNKMKFLIQSITALLVAVSGVDAYGTYCLSP